MAVERRQGAKVKMAPPSYKGLPIITLAQRITELDNAIEVVHKLRGAENREEWEDAATGTLLYSDAMVLIKELTTDKQRYIDALADAAKHSEFLEKKD